MARRKQTARKNKKGNEKITNKPQVNGIDKTTGADKTNRYRHTGLVLNGIRQFAARQRRQDVNTADSVGREMMLARRIRGLDV